MDIQKQTNDELAIAIRGLCKAHNLTEVELFRRAKEGLKRYHQMQAMAENHAHEPQ